MRLSLGLFLIVPFVFVSAQIKTHEVKTKGEFAEINYDKTRTIIDKLSKKDTSAISEIMRNSGSYAPPALYLLSDLLFQNGEKDKASFWFYAAQLRNRSDINKCKDPSAISAVAVLNQNFGPQINNYTMVEKADIKFIEETVNKVVEWDEKTPRDYDPRWIALNGMAAFTDSLIDFEPKSNWEKIDIQSREEYKKGFVEALPTIKMHMKQKSNGANKE